MASPATDAPVPVLGYVRVSLMREDAISPDIQRSVVTAAAGRSGRRVIRWVTDLDASGRNFRRKVMSAIAAVEAGEAGEIWLYRYDRWGRNALEALANVGRVERAGGQVVSATEPVDAATAIGRFTRTQSFAVAELLSDQIGDGWKAAHASRVASGVPASGTPRFGYVRLGRVPDPVRAHVWRKDVADRDGERYEPDPVTGPVLAALYRMYTAGAGTTRLLRWLADRGVTTTRGATFSTIALLRVLDSGFGAGVLRVHDPVCGCARHSKCGRVVFVPGSHEPVITATEWDAYRQARADRARIPPRSRDPVYPLSGLVRCGTCGSPCVAAFSNGQRGYGYRCQSWVQHRGCPGVWARRSEVERQVLEWLGGVSAETEAAAAAAKARARAVTDASAARRRHQADMERADRELRRLLRRGIEAEGIPDEVYEQVRAELLAERAAAQAALERASRAGSLNSAGLAPVARRLLEEWDVLAAGTRRELLSRLVSRVTITRTGPRMPAEVRVHPLWEDA